MSLQRVTSRTDDDIVQLLLKNSREEQSFVGQSSHMFPFIIFTISFNHYIVVFKNGVNSMKFFRVM